MLGVKGSGKQRCCLDKKILNIIYLCLYKYMYLKKTWYVKIYMDSNGSIIFLTYIW